ncbi:MAG: FliH/SctL family protein, partial [SAR324 cluster bacterium]|nr:FliH/SctL family protein [SAR324 cluster bacterium]
MLDESEFKPFSLTDFSVVETESAETVDSSAGNESAGEGSNSAEQEIEERLASFKPLTFDVEGGSSEFVAKVSADAESGKTDAEKIQLSKSFKNAEFFQENSLLTNAEDFAETIRDGAKLYKTQLLAKIEERATDTERIHQKTVVENREADEERDKLLSATEDKVNEIKNEAFNEGFEAGRLEGMQKRYDEAERLVLQVHSVLEQLNSLRQVVRFQAEVELVELALRIAKNIVAEEIKIPNDVIKNIVQAALHETEVQGKIYVYLHPDDYEFLLKSKADLERYMSDEQTLAIRDNPEMKPGSIYVESDEEIISRSIEDQFNKLEKTLAEQKENRHAHLSEVDIDAHDFSIRP